MKEQIIVVDENDNIIGHKERGTLIFPKDIYRVSALRIENSKGEILIAQRSFSKKNQGGVRGPATAGTNAMGETYESNIIKEAQEEIGLKLTKYKIGPKKFIKSENKNRRYFCQRFKAITDKKISQFKLQKDEVETIQRIKKNELQKRVKNKPKDFTSNANEYIKLFCK